MCEKIINVIFVSKNCLWTDFVLINDNVNNYLWNVQNFIFNELEKRNSKMSVLTEIYNINRNAIHFNFGWYIEFSLHLNILFSQLWLILSIVFDSSQFSKTVDIMLNFAWYGLASTLYKCRHVLFYANVSFILIKLFFHCIQFPIHWIYLITVLYLFYFLNFTALLLFFIYALLIKFLRPW